MSKVMADSPIYVHTVGDTQLWRIDFDDGIEQIKQSRDEALIDAQAVADREGR